MTVFNASLVNAFELDNDYIIPAADQIIQRVQPLTNLSAQTVLQANAEQPIDFANCVTCGGNPVLYFSFSGAAIQMLEYPGRFVSVLIPPGRQELSLEQIAILRDRLDVLYEHYRDLIGIEPAGSGLLTVAFLDNTCAFGCATVGSKGTEYNLGASAVEQYIDALNVGRLHAVFVHEMAHNFDVFSNLMGYLADPPHQWTAFFQFFGGYHFAHSSSDKRSALSISNDRFDDFWLPYANNPSANWQTCVRDGACENQGIFQNFTWGGFGQLFAQTFGTDAVRRMFAVYRQARNSNPNGIASSAELREDLRLRAFSEATQSNLSCLADRFRWLVLENTRTELNNRFGAMAPICLDGDADGVTPLDGDCDDSDAAIHPNRIELPDNNIDDNCSGAVDEPFIIEGGADGEFGMVSGIQAPVGIRGTAQANDIDSFLVDGRPTGSVRIKLCSLEDFNGSFTVSLDADMSQLPPVPVGPGQCNSSTVVFTGNQLLLEIHTVADQAADYQINIIAEVDSWPPVRNPSISFTNNIDDQLQLSVIPLQEMANDESWRFWVSGVGFVEATSTDGVRFDVDLSTAQLDPSAKHWLRVQSVQNDNPTGEVSDPLSFSLIGTRQRASRTFWFNPERSGHGIELGEAAGVNFLAWYTFDEHGDPVWYTSRPATAGSQWSTDLRESTFDGMQSQSRIVGTVQFSRLADDQAEFSWILDASRGNEPFTSIGGDGGCVNDENQTGSWFVPAAPGFGTSVLRSAEFEGHIFYLYDTNGLPRWVIGQTGNPEDIAISMQVSTEGFCPGCEFRPPLRSAAGELNRTYNSASSGTLMPDYQFIHERFELDWQLGGISALISTPRPCTDLR